MYRHYTTLEGPKIVSPEDGITPGARISTFAQQHRDFRLLSRRLIPAQYTRKKTAASAMVRVYVNNLALYGEVTAVFTHKQTGYPAQDFAAIRWMKATREVDQGLMGLWQRFRSVPFYDLLFKY